MEFKMTSRFFGHMKNSPIIVFTEDNPPEWLVHRENVWWWETQVKKLQIGQTVQTDFQNIERIA